MINFFEEDIAVPLKEKRALKAWLKQLAAEEGKKIVELNYIFCSDSYLLEINKQYLNHNTLTDIITFDQSEKPNQIEGDIYISYERVLENGRTLKTEENELYRVIAHGLLHLCGYKDKSEEEEKTMREKENFYLTKR
ncbi:rRNA maturation RNase YbeY [Sandaracinomonas limnophila]|uniref:Endoribonuclease YbeY n=1 Tax=Sandaracinomonas limnophila TaxID=1862386 RepID=A0A437PPF9_9BACT|nr:rRNA maturation RNase YbeY [Sandaracinomonas limnophila]RVU24218.1 rRNA maturation RNase YbeY [Sandaracinomonas limnophila]